MPQKQCDVCGKGISSFTSYLSSYNGKDLFFCNDCWKQYMHLQKEGTPKYTEAKDFFLQKIEQKTVSATMLENLGTYPDLDISVHTDNQSETTHQTPLVYRTPLANSSSSSSDSGTGILIFITIGIVFLIAAIALFVSSRKDVGGLQVANIQATVFAAAAFIIANINFTAAGLLRYMKK